MAGEKMKIGDIIGIIGIVFVVMFVALMIWSGLASQEPSRQEVNATWARGVLRTLSTAAESFKASNKVYPQGMEDLLTAKPPYLNQDYCAQEINGYRFECHLSADGYTFVAETKATPDRKGRVYTIKTNGILTPEK